IEGRVTDPDGEPVAGVGVRGVPRGEDIPWWPAATTAVPVRPGATVGGVRLVFDAAAWRNAGAADPPDDPSCPGRSAR
ncbi:MAG TPA: hypothetical protein VFA98_09125, partial [Thermoanaerobaculia bacterium]|nr:hypothetical protein [Thermoanaerobaculia bacterium]